jgi:hypothetical protein
VSDPNRPAYIAARLALELASSGELEAAAQVAASAVELVEFVTRNNTRSGLAHALSLLSQALRIEAYRAKPCDESPLCTDMTQRAR